MADLAVRRCRPLLGTFVEIAAPAGSEHAVDRAFSAIAHVHACMSFHEETSDLALLRRAAPDEAVRVDPDTVTVLGIAADLHRCSAGLFDVTVGASLVAAGYLPRPAGVDLRRMTGRMNDIEPVDEHTVRCRRPMLIDLGGIAKGFAVDRAVETLVACGIDHTIVNAGGDLRVIGDHKHQIVLNGFDGEPEAIVELACAALASSGVRSERRRHRGRAASPHRGALGAAVIGERSVSVIAGTCTVADAMTKVALADPTVAEAMLAELGGEIVARHALAEAA